MALPLQPAAGHGDDDAVVVGHAVRKEGTRPGKPCRGGVLRIE